MSVGSISEALYRYIQRQEEQNMPARTEDIINKFRKSVDRNTLNKTLDNLTRRGSLLRAASGRTTAHGGVLHVYRVNPQKVWAPKNTGRRVSTEKLEAVIKDLNSSADTSVVDDQASIAANAATKPVAKPKQQYEIPRTAIQNAWEHAVKEKVDVTITTTDTTPAIPREWEVMPSKPEQATSKVVDSLLKPAEVVHTNVQIIRKPVRKTLAVNEVDLPPVMQEDTGAVMMILDLGQGKTEIVDTATAKRLYRSLQNVFG